jgi:hypothetical protein
MIHRNVSRARWTPSSAKSEQDEISSMLLHQCQCILLLPEFLRERQGLRNDKFLPYRCDRLLLWRLLGWSYPNDYFRSAELFSQARVIAYSRSRAECAHGLMRRRTLSKVWSRRRIRLKLNRKGSIRACFGQRRQFDCALRNDMAGGERRFGSIARATRKKLLL